MEDLGREARELAASEVRAVEDKRAVVVAQQESAAAADAAAAAAEVAALLVLVRTMAAPPVEMLGYMKPGQTADIWTDDVLAAAAAPLVAIMERHGWAVADLLGTWGPYAMLFVATGVPAVATYKAVRENKAEKAAARERAAAAGGVVVEAGAGG